MTADPPSISDGGITNGASFLAGIVPTSWISVFGSNLATSTALVSDADLVSGCLPTTFGGVSVTIDGRPAYISYVSPTQRRDSGRQHVGGWLR